MNFAINAFEVRDGQHLDRTYQIETRKVRRAVLAEAA